VKAPVAGSDSSIRSRAPTQAAQRGGRERKRYGSVTRHATWKRIRRLPKQAQDAVRRLEPQHARLGAGIGLEVHRLVRDHARPASSSDERHRPSRLTSETCISARKRPRLEPQTRHATSKKWRTRRRGLGDLGCRRRDPARTPGRESRVAVEREWLTNERRRHQCRRADWFMNPFGRIEHRQVPNLLCSWIATAPCRAWVNANEHEAGPSDRSHRPPLPATVTASSE